MYRGHIVRQYQQGQQIEAVVDVNNLIILYSFRFNFSKNKIANCALNKGHCQSLRLF